MSSEYKLDNGWLVKRESGGKPILYVTPIPNTLFRKNQAVEITEAIFKDISKGETDLKNLFKKHNLHMLIIEQGAKEVKPIPRPKINTETMYQGIDFFVTEETGRYFFKYRLSRQGDGERKFEITKEIYEDARKGDKSTSDLFKKYNLYHLDIPENNVK